MQVGIFWFFWGGLVIWVGKRESIQVRKQNSTHQSYLYPTVVFHMWTSKQSRAHTTPAPIVSSDKEVIYWAYKTQPLPSHFPPQSPNISKTQNQPRCLLSTYDLQCMWTDTWRCFLLLKAQNSIRKRKYVYEKINQNVGQDTKGVT